MKSTAASPQQMPFGWRYVKRLQADGTETLDEVPLTLEDVLHPQYGDSIPQDTLHSADLIYLRNVFKLRETSPDVFVASRLLVEWGVAGIRPHAPDLAAYFGLNREPPGGTSLLDLPSYGGRCELIVEIVAPHTRETDVTHKFDHYCRIGIPLYVIVDREDWSSPRHLRGYRWASARYEEVEPDSQGRIALPPVGLLLGMTKNRVVCYDAQTGKILPDYSILCRQLEVAKEMAAQRQQLQQCLDEEKACRERLQELGQKIEEVYRRYQELKAQDEALEQVCHLSDND